MSKNIEQKNQEVERLSDKLAKIKIGVLTSYTGLKVMDMNELRRGLQAEGVEYQAAKKTLLKVALEKAGIKDTDPKNLEGSLALAFGYDDEVSAPKFLKKFQKSNENLKILGGIYEGQFISAEKILELASIPSKEELMAKLVWTIKGPLSGFYNALNGNLVGLVNVLNAVKDIK